MNYFILIYSGAIFMALLGLWFAGDLAVRYSIEMSKKFNLDSLFIGFVLIAVATGLPELFVVFSSISRGVGSISAGDILGSNVCDISLVLGLAVLLYGTIFLKPKENKNSFIMLLVTTICMAIVFILGALHRILGLILILIYLVVVWWLWNNRTRTEKVKEEKGHIKVIRDGDTFLTSKLGVCLKLAFSVILMLMATEFSVYIAVKLTKLLSLSLHTAGATIFAIGTSFPELSLALNAVRKKEYSLALGNSLGSVLEQGTLILGILALGSKKTIDIKPLRGLGVFMLISFAIIGFGMLKRKKISRVEGALMVLVYISFIIYQLFWVG